MTNLTGKRRIILDTDAPPPPKAAAPVSSTPKTATVVRPFDSSIKIRGQFESEIQRLAQRRQAEQQRADMADDRLRALQQVTREQPPTFRETRREIEGRPDGPTRTRSELVANLAPGEKLTAKAACGMEPGCLVTIDPDTGIARPAQNNAEADGIVEEWTMEEQRWGKVQIRVGVRWTR